MVTHNELNRYLPGTIKALREATGERPVVYDDASTDGTYQYLEHHDITVIGRNGGQASFQDSESQFRQDGWQRLAAVAEDGDWVLSLDADEFIAPTRSESALDALHGAIADVEDQGVVALSCPVEEIFGIDPDGFLLRRTDGFWSTINATRLARWHPDAEFEPCPEGGGSVPTALQQVARPTDRFVIVHLGYLRPEDRMEKHQRHVAAGGHSLSHVRSILGTPKLAPCLFLVPPEVSGLLR
jgi:hypothetical protein